jgi:transcriptional regulator with PAS, ATPase and Fis domain
MTLGDTIEIKRIQGFYGTSPVADSAEHESVSLQERGIHDYSKLLDEGISLDEYVSRCEFEYLRYAIDRYKSTYRAADALGASQSSVMRRKKKHRL